MYKAFKRIMDWLLSLAAIVLLSPLWIGIALAVCIDSPGPVLFTQKRVGRGKKLFNIYKFRTMRTDTPHDVPTHLLSNPDQYITRVGRFLRKTSLDELPQIWNIFIGDMSVIGPRPALWNQYDLIAERDKYHGRWDMTPNDVRPGLTGWAQIHGRDELTIVEKARLDGEYLAYYGIGVDVRCFWQTIISVLKHEGVVEGGTGAMPNPPQQEEKP